MVVDAGRGDGGTLFVQGANVPQPVPADPFAAFTGAPGAPRAIQARDKNAPAFAPQVVVAVEHYNRVVRMLQAGEQVQARAQPRRAVSRTGLDGLQHRRRDSGQRPDLKEEVVMLGGHMDSWHGGTGATDNAAGVAVAMEAVRIIKALDLQAAPHDPRRPVDGRGAGPLRLARLRQRALRRTRHADGSRRRRASPRTPRRRPRRRRGW